MLHSPFRLISSALALVLVCVAFCAAQEATAEDSLAIAVAASDGKSAALLESKPELVNPALVRALGVQANKLALQGKFPPALSVYEIGLAVARKINDQPGQAASLYGQGQIHSLMGQNELAEREFTESLALRRNLNDSGGIGAALNQLGVLQSKQGNQERALELYRESLPLMEKGGNKIEQSGLMINVGNAYKDQGLHERAIEYYDRALKLASEAGNQARIAIALTNVAQVYTTMGNYALALEAHQKSLRIKELQNNKLGIAISHSNIGEVYRLQGNYGLALVDFDQALNQFLELGARQGAAYAWNNIGLVHQAQGNFPLAKEFLQKALKQFEELKDKPGIAEAQNNLGSAERASGNYEAAMALYRQSLKQSQAANDRGRTAQSVVYIADIYLRQNKPGEALIYAERAATGATEVGSRETLWMARTVAGKAYRVLGRPELARTALEGAIKEIETLRNQVSGGERDQQSFFEDRVTPYYEMVGLLVDQQRFVEALAFAERAKGRVLLDVLQSGRTNVTKSMTDDERSRERALLEKIAALNSQLSRLRLDPEPGVDRLAAAEGQLQIARLELESFTNSLFTAHPELRVRRGQGSHQFTETNAGELLDAKTALLEYVVTDQEVILFVLTRSKGNGSEGILLKHYRIAVGRKVLAKQVEMFRRSLADRDAGFAAAARRLYDLLVRPAREQLIGRSNTIIVPDDSLWELPFQALRNTPQSYFVEQSALSYAPSLSVLRAMRRPSRTAAVTNRPTLLAFGDPAGREPAGGKPSASGLSQLPEANKEVRSLAQLYGAGASYIYTDAEARESRVKEEAGKFSVLHFATHGILTDSSPLYSHLILSRGEKDDDGMLEAWEIMQLDLKTDLVVLSACETARGRVGAGEGMIGLTWAFFVAGSPATLVSQWKVDSAATSSLMVDFHRRWLGTARSRLSKSEALRQAALKMMRSGDYAHPFYWAGFIVVGDDR